MSQDHYIAELESSLSSLQDQVRQIVEEMRHELFRVGNHPALGIPADTVERWIASLLPPVSVGGGEHE